MINGSFLLHFFFKFSRFLGDLFTANVLSDKMIDKCIQHLLNKSEDEESLSSVCKLLLSIGEELDSRCAIKATPVVPLFTVIKQQFFYLLLQNLIEFFTGSGVNRRFVLHST